MRGGRRTLFAVVGLLSAVALLLVLDKGGEDVTRPSPGPTGLPSAEEGGSPLSGNGPSEVATALPPGEYTVDLWLEGTFRETRKVRIEAGETAEVAVTLRRR